MDKVRLVVEMLAEIVDTPTLVEIQEQVTGGGSLLVDDDLLTVRGDFLDALGDVLS